jgi:hypothetical protein
MQSEVDAHVANCANCRAEVAEQTRVRDAIVSEESRTTSAEASFDELWSQIRAEESPGSGKAGAAHAKQSRIVHWLAAAVILEAVGLGTLAFNGSGVSRPAAALYQAPAVYQTLSSPAPRIGGPAIRAVFVSDVTLRDLQDLLGRLQLRIVNGPTEAGVYTLATDDKNRSLEATLADLRGNMFVRFAEPIGGGLAHK